MSAFQILQGIGLALNIFGLIREAGEQREAGDLQADLERTRVAAEEAETADLEAQKRVAARKLVGRQRAQFASAGVRQEGTPLLVQAQTLLDAEEDVLRIRATGEAKTFAFKIQAKRFRDIGRAKEKAALGKIGTSLITAAGGFIT